MPLLSVCIPVYNGEKYICECLEPLVKMDDVEIICVDDGSSDNSLKILNDYKEKYNCITVLSQANKGQSIARNAALKKVTGKYVAFVDVDDYLETRAIDYLKEIDVKYSPDFIQFGVVSEFDNWSDSKELLYPSSKLLNEKEAKELYAYICGYKDNRDIGHDYFGLVSCKFYKYELVKDVEFVSDIVGEDTLYACTVGQVVKTSYFLSEYLYHYRSQSGTYSHKVMKDIVPKSVKMLREMKSIMSIDSNTDKLLYTAYYGQVYSKFKWCLDALNFFKIKEINYCVLILKDIFSHEEYRELLEVIDILPDEEGILWLLTKVKDKDYYKAATLEKRSRAIERNL